jgi:hypothetical protein
MSLLTCALVVSAFLPEPTATDSYSTSSLSEFLAPASSAPAPVVADADSLLSYTYIEVGAAQYDVDDLDDDVDTYYARGSLGLFKLFYLFGEYSNQSTDFEDTSTDLITLGAGAHFGALPQIDLYAEVGWLYSDASSDLEDLDETDSGYVVEGGVRWLPFEWTSGGLEIDGAIGQINLDNRFGSDDDPVYWSLGARAHFIRFLSVGLAYEMYEDDEQVLANVRWSF